MARVERVPEAHYVDGFLQWAEYETRDKGTFEVDLVREKEDELVYTIKGEREITVAADREVMNYDLTSLEPEDDVSVMNALEGLRVEEKSVRDRNRDKVLSKNGYDELILGSDISKSLEDTVQ